ncbi:PKS-ER domain-containing protein [Fusarium sp. Ph1]|nr:PKS-ER domain-containing protein [Fusarium sp. Ph1]
MAHEAIPKRMKALRLQEYSQSYVLRDDVPIPIPKTGEVLVRMAASSFCHTDFQVIQGVYKTKLPVTGSHEPAGTVAALGEGVRGDWKLGDRVGVLNFRNPCGSCSGCKWALEDIGSLDPRFCKDITMAGILGADGGFAQYMVAPEDTLVTIPDTVSFEQAAPLMCAGVTVWNAIKQTGLKNGGSIGVVGIGGLGILAIQFAKALGYQVVAVDNRDIGLRLASEVPSHLKPDAIVKFGDEEAAKQISDLTRDIGLHGAVVCTDDVEASDWALHQLRPRGVCVVLGLPEQGYKFDAFNLVFREIAVKGSIFTTADEARKMLEVVGREGVRSHLTLLKLEEGEVIYDKVAAHDFDGRLVVTID